jgi:DNA-binding MarR family transcriptional regulator
MSSVNDYRKRLPEGPRGDLEHALFRVLKSLVFRADPTSPMNEMPLSQLKCLHIVGESEGQKMIDIAHKMEIGLPAVSQIVDRLVRRGLFERQPDPLDRRVVRVILTDSARSLVEEGRQYRQRRMNAPLVLLAEQELGTVTKGLELLAEAAERVESSERSSQTASVSANVGDQSAPNGDPLVEMIADRARSRRITPLHDVLPTAGPARP